MPLKCLRGTEEIYAFEVESDAVWEALRSRSAAERDLTMPCCGAGVVLRESKLGTRHFAHARRGPCRTAAESAEHLLAKRAVIDGIRSTAWRALPEQADTTPDGEDWKADVLAVKGEARIAFEIQWSRQDHEETCRRQMRYGKSRVRGLWFFRQHDFSVTKDIPAFRLVLDEESKRFSVWLPSPRYSRDWVSAREKDEPHYWQQKVPLEEFVQGALAGRLKYAPALGLRVPLEVYAGYDQCWRCKRETGRVLELRFDIGRVLPGCADLTTDLYGFAEHYPDGERLIHTLLPPARLREVGIGQLQRRFSKTEGQAYLSNGCVHCGALQGRFFDHEFYDGGDKVLETEAVLEEAFVRRRDNRNRVYRWWFDTRPSSMPSAAPTTALSSRDCE